MAVTKTANLKFAMMSGALKNAGDFLIVRRSEGLIRHIYPNAELFFYNRCKSIEEYMEDINRMDAMIFCGGPAYIPQLYPQAFPLVSDLNRIRVPMFALGLGWFGSSSANKAVYNYRFSESAKMLLRRIESDTKLLGCRDWYSVGVLRNEGIWSGRMTGCPAWYDPDFIDQQDFVQTDPRQVKKVCISDPADPGYLQQMVTITEYLRRLYPNAECKVVFHRGTSQDAYTSGQSSRQIGQAIQTCQQLGADCVDISYGQDGFTVYDDCDLHVGFRVHAHIYNLSRRNCSILIEEDGRGAGVNSALGLWRMTAYDYAVKSWPDGERTISTVGKSENTYLLQILDDYLNNLYQADFLQIKHAFRLMQEYYQRMKQHVEGLSDCI